MEKKMESTTVGDYDKDKDRDTSLAHALSCDTYFARLAQDQPLLSWVPLLPPLYYAPSGLIKAEQGGT